MTLRSLFLAAAFATAGVTAAHANISFSPTGGSTGDVIQFESHFASMTSFFGDTNHAAQAVQFLTFPTGTVQLIGTSGSGQADITCSSGCGTDTTGGANGQQLTGLEIKLGTGLGATEFIGNLDFGEGTASIRVTDQLGAVFNYTLGNGSNFFTLTATNNEVITDIQISEAATSSNPFGWNDLKQPRIGGLCTLVGTTCTPISVPEPGSLAVLGAGLLSLGFFARRRHT